MKYHKQTVNNINLTMFVVSLNTKLLKRVKAFKVVIRNENNNIDARTMMIS